MPPTSAAGVDNEAIVIGSSMAGLLAARVLADHFGRVTLIDRDRLPDGAAFRKGVPQSRHLHILLARGLEIVRQLFPGIDEDLLAAGAVPVEWPRDALWLTSRGWSRRFSLGIRVLSASRELVEWTVRRRLLATGNVCLLQGHEAVGLLPSADGRAVAGVRLRARPSADGTAGEVADLPAGFVVDASGRNSRSPEWLAQLGYEPPAETKISSFLGYASRYYAIPKDAGADWRIIVLQGKPPAIARGGALFPVEGDRWLVTLAGAGRDYPPTDDDGFLAFAQSLRSPVLFEAIRNAEPLTPVYGYQRTENQRRSYERLDRQPERFLVTGDAICAFNPIYAQGMTAAAQGALVLAQLLREHAGRDLIGLPRRFQADVAKANAGAWLVATGEDLRYPTTEGGDRNLQTRLSHRYLDRVIGAATRNREVNRAFLNVLQLVAPPTTLFRPGVLVPALLRGGMGNELTPPRARRDA
jgi:2-polyprenyl-6-methoxyphenol hydroxylase-like FAD-dependent oxidoreductase